MIKQLIADLRKKYPGVPEELFQELEKLTFKTDAIDQEHQRLKVIINELTNDTVFNELYGFIHVAVGLFHETVKTTSPIITNKTIRRDSMKQLAADGTILLFKYKPEQKENTKKEKKKSWT